MSRRSVRGFSLLFFLWGEGNHVGLLFWCTFCLRRRRRIGVERTTLAQRKTQVRGRAGVGEQKCYPGHVPFLGDAGPSRERSRLKPRKEVGVDRRCRERVKDPGPSVRVKKDWKRSEKGKKTCAPVEKSANDNFYLQKKGFHEE